MTLCLRFTAAGLAVLLAGPPAVPQSKAMESSAVREVQLSGVLRVGGLYLYALESDRPLFVLRGTKSEGSTREVELGLPAALTAKAEGLNGKRVTVLGRLACDGNWRGATCFLKVRTLEPDEALPGQESAPACSACGAQGVRDPDGIWVLNHKNDCPHAAPEKKIR